MRHLSRQVRMTAKVRDYDASSIPLTVSGWNSHVRQCHGFSSIMRLPQAQQQGAIRSWYGDREKAAPLVSYRPQNDRDLLLLSVVVPHS